MSPVGKCFFLISFSKKRHLGAIFAALKYGRSLEFQTWAKLKTQWEDYFGIANKRHVIIAKREQWYINCHW